MWDGCCPYTSSDNFWLGLKGTRKPQPGQRWDVPHCTKPRSCRVQPVDLPFGGVCIQQTIALCGQCRQSRCAEELPLSRVLDLKRSNRYCSPFSSSDSGNPANASAHK